MLIKQNFIPHYFRHYKYHILTIFRILTSGFNHPKFNSKDINKYCELIHNKLLNESETKKLVTTATECIQKALNSYNDKYGRRNINDYKRLKDFTLEVIQQAKKLDPVFHSANNVTTKKPSR
jgi:hypothetical protein